MLVWSNPFFFTCCFIHIFSVLVPHKSVEHGHEMHGASASSGHEHQREDGEAALSVD